MTTSFLHFWQFLQTSLYTLSFFLLFTAFGLMRLRRETHFGHAVHYFY
jgi:hypothetical protein